MAHACGGKARCSTCRVLVVDGRCSPRAGGEGDLAELLCLEPAIRLGCQAGAETDVIVRRLVLDEEDVELTSLLIRDASPDDVGREKQVVVMFADIRGFTAFAESLLPYDVVHVLDRYFHRMGRIIAEHGGAIYNYMGDGLLALFESEEPSSSALGAVRAGLAMTGEVDRMKPVLEGLYGKSFDIGIGMHFGLVVAGSVGATDNRRVSVIGDAVNFASRVEQANKQAGTRLLISGDLHRILADRLRVGRSPRVAIQGKTGEHTLFEITGVR
jgi:adenylate cyclase